MKVTPVRLLAAAIVSSGSAHAQQPAIEEIIVTAQKKAESLQDVPLAVTAFDGDRIENGQLLTVEDVALQTPGFANSTYNPASPQPYIRGVGTNSSNVGDDASVGVFIDEVYAGRAGGYRADLFDVARIEVLRGPQGTLYGRNVAGGAMNIITRGPTDEFEAYVTLGTGSWNLLSGKAAVSGPLSDGVRGRLALSSRQRDGWTDNTVTGEELRDEDNVSARGKLEFDLGERATLLLGADYSSDDLTGPAARGFIGSPLENLPTFDDRDDVALNFDGFTERDIWGTMARLDIDFDSGTLTSITAYRENDYEFLDDLTGGGSVALFGLPLINAADETSEQFTQEVRFSGAGERFDYTVGLYYFLEDVDRFETFDSSPLAAPGLSRPTWNASNESTSYAVFGETSYDVSDTLSVTLGARWTYDEKEFDNVAANPDLFGFLNEAYTVSESEDWDELTPKVAVEYRPADATLLYASYSLGFKSGGFNGLAPTGALAATPFDPENATSYEAGMKSEWLDRRLRLNVALFYTDYEDLQNFFLDEGVVVTATADAEIQGIEVELAAALGAGISVDASYAYLDAEYTRFPSEPAVEGNRLMRSPEHAGNLGVQYETEIGGIGQLLLRGDVAYQGEVFFDVQNTPESGNDEFTLVNALARLSVGQHIELSVFGRNLGDEEYFQHSFDLAGAGFPIYGEPRNWGISGTYRF